MKAVARGLAARLAGPTDVYQPLHATMHAMELVMGARAPEGDAETKLVSTRYARPSGATARQSLFPMRLGRC